VVFERKGLLETYEFPLGEGVIVLVAALYFAVPADVRRFKEMKYGRRLRGPVMLTPKEFKREVGGRGIGFKTTEMKELMRIPVRNEAQHFQLMGDTGVGKTQLIMQILRQIQGRGDSAIVYDPACEYIQRFYDQGRGDIVLNPLDARCPYWGPASEMRSNAEADAIAASLYQPATDQKDEFFHETPAQIFAHLLKLGPTPHELAAWMASAREIESRVSGTEMEHYIGQKAGPQRSGVLSSLGLVAKSFRLLPTKEQTGDRVWSATDWAEHRRGWVFITSRPSERVTLRPLHSLWIDLLVMRLLTKPTPRQRQVWFVIDELASLQRLPQLHTAVTENRKSKNPLVLGFQGKAQLEVIYGHLAEVMLSQPATKIFMKTAEPKAAEWISAAIGKVEIERLKETKFDGSRSGKNFTLDRQVEPLVMDSEISGLTEKHAYLKLGNNVARFAFEYLDLPSRSADFVARKAQEDELIFDPKTLEKKKPTATPKPVTEAKDHAAESKPFAALPREESPAVSGAGERNQPLSTPAGMPSQPQQNAEPDPGAEAEDALADRRNREDGKAISGAGLDADHDAQDALSFEEDVAIEDERTEVENTIRMGGF
jgi:type IV secretory pathway TraG/TraD family ATPase VirD4